MRLRHLLMTAAITSCSASTDAPAQAAGVHPHRVLFIGNSLTYVNDMPGTVAAIARDNGDSVVVVMAAGPNLALIDHLTGSTAAVSLLRDSSWDAVVLQQGPTTTTLCRDSMVLWTKMFEPLIKRGGGTSVTLMTWPAVSQGDVWDAAHMTALLAAATVHGVLAPAGRAWQMALAAHPGLPLYGSDGYHPSPLGSFLTALVVYQRLAGRDPRTLAPHAFTGHAPFAIHPDTLAWLAAAAASANAAEPASPAMPDPVPPARPQPPGGNGC